MMQFMFLKQTVGRFLAVAFLTGVSTLALANDSSAVKDALDEYFDFAGYGDGVVSVAQLKSLGEIQYIDTRKEEDYAASHIDGAIHIEWRQVVFHLDQISKEKLVVLYCDTGILSSKSHLALRLLGYENVRVLFGGYQAYQQQ